MSSLIEQIVRRRRASASRRLGPPGQLPGAYGAGVPTPNGSPPAPLANAAPEPVPAPPPPPAGPETTAPSNGAGAIIEVSPVAQAVELVAEPAIEPEIEPAPNGSAPVDVPLRDRGETIVWSPRRPAPRVEPPAPPEPEVVPEVAHEPEPEVVPEPEPEVAREPEPEVVPEPEPEVAHEPEPEPQPEPERKYVPLRSFDPGLEDLRTEPEPIPAIPWTADPTPKPEENQSWTYATASLEPLTATPEPEIDTEPEPEQLDGDSERRRRLPRWPRASRARPPELETLAPDAVPQAEVAPEAETDAAPEVDAASEPDIESEPGFVERGSIRRRARYLRALREVQLRDIGGFVVELHRFGRERPDLVLAKVEGAQRTDIELRALHRLLGDSSSIRELREAGIGGACGNCGAVHGSEDRYCASCGEPLEAELYAPDDAAEPGADGST